MSEATFECSEFQGRYLDTIRGWDAFMQEQGSDPILDVDVAPERPARRYEDIGAIRTDLEELAESIPSDEPDRPIVEQSVRGNLTFMRALQGESIDFTEFVRGTIGFTPEPLGAGAIDTSAARLDKVLGYGGIRYDAGSKEQFDASLLTSGTEIKAAVEAGAITARQAAGAFLEDVPDSEIQPEYVSRDEFGVSTITQRPDGSLRWEVNVLPERYPLDIGRINTIAAHEVTGHVFHIETLARNIRAGRTNPIVGATAAHLPYAFQAEALAQNAEFLFLDNSWENVSKALYNAHATMVLYDVHWRVNHDEDPEAIFAELRDEEKLPFEPEAFYSADFIKSLRDNPMYRAYLAVYYPSVHAMEPLRTGMQLDQQRDVLNSLYNRAVTPQELAASLVAYAVA
jgi:hypothetical protein